MFIVRGGNFRRGGAAALIALLERRQQLYWLIGATAVTVAFVVLLSIHLPGDAPLNLPVLYLLSALTIGSGAFLLFAPRWLVSRPYLFWPIAGVLFPIFEALAVYFTGGVRSPYFVLFYFSLFFLGMVGGHRGAIWGSVVIGIAYIAASVVRLGSIELGSLLMRFTVTLASFYGIAFFAAFLGNIASQEARDASRRAMRIAALNVVNANLGETLDHDALLEKIPSELCRQLHFERALLYIVEDEKLRLVSGHTNEEPERLERLMEYLRAHPPGLSSHSVEGEAARSRRPVLSVNARRDPRVNPLVLEIAQTSSFAAVPLIAKDELIGVVVADYFRQDHVITEEELILLHTFASLAAVALLNNQLVVQASRAEAFRELDTLKTDFLATVSHELRTPLTLVRASSDLLLDDVSEGLNTTQRKLVETVGRNSNRLAAFVDEILEMAQLDEGRIKLNLQITDLRHLVNEVAQALHLLIGDRQQTLYLDIPDEPCLVEVDRHRMQQVITNLLTNACKYTPAGGEIWVRLAPDADRVVVEVRDNGPGIPAEKLGYIFEKFYRLPGSDRLAMGTGLGLAITRSLVELHGGTISAFSTQGEGTSFKVSLERLREPGPMIEHVGTPVAELTS